MHQKRLHRQRGNRGQVLRAQREPTVVRLEIHALSADGGRAARRDGAGAGVGGAGATGPVCEGSGGIAHVLAINRISRSGSQNEGWAREPHFLSTDRGPICHRAVVRRRGVDRRPGFGQDAGRTGPRGTNNPAPRGRERGNWGEAGTRRRPARPRRAQNETGKRRVEGEGGMTEPTITCPNYQEVLFKAKESMEADAVTRPMFAGPKAGSNNHARPRR